MADIPDALGRFLARNPDLSYCAFVSSEMVDTILCGSDGRRGYILRYRVNAAREFLEKIGAKA